MLFGAVVMLVNPLVVVIILPSRIRAPREDSSPVEEQERDVQGVAVAGD
jgi:hypothetical protein